MTAVTSHVLTAPAYSEAAAVGSAFHAASAAFSSALSVGAKGHANADQLYPAAAHAAAYTTYELLRASAAAVAASLARTARPPLWTPAELPQRGPF